MQDGKAEQALVSVVSTTTTERSAPAAAAAASAAAAITLEPGAPPPGVAPTAAAAPAANPESSPKRPQPDGARPMDEGSAKKRSRGDADREEQPAAAAVQVLSSGPPGTKPAAPPRALPPAVQPGGIRIPPSGREASGIGATPGGFRMCQHFAGSGWCVKGAACGFAHGDEELTYWNQRYQPISKVNTPLAGPRPLPTTNLNMGSFALCRHFSINGSCRMAERCKFAHGIEELNAWNVAAGKPKLTEQQVEAQLNRNRKALDATQLRKQERQQLGEWEARIPDSVNGQAQRNPDGSLVALCRPMPEASGARSVPVFKLCTGFAMGNCRHKYCKFPHGDTELQYWRECQSANVVAAAQTKEPSNTAPPRPKPAVLVCPSPPPPGSRRDSLCARC